MSDARDFLEGSDVLERVTLAQVKRLYVQPGETLLIQTSQHLTLRELSRIQDHVRGIMPTGAKVLVVGPEWKLSVLAKPLDA
jgi:hypothetical protein